MAACSPCSWGRVRLLLMIARISLGGTYICISGNGMSMMKEFNEWRSTGAEAPLFCHFFHASSPKKKVSTAKWHPTSKIKTRTNPTHIGGIQDTGNENENENNWIVKGKEDEGKKEGSRESPFVEILYLDEASFFFFSFLFFLQIKKRVLLRRLYIVKHFARRGRWRNKGTFCEI